MEMMLVLEEDEEAADVGGIKSGLQDGWRRGYRGNKTRVVALQGVVCHHTGLHV